MGVLRRTQNRLTEAKNELEAAIALDRNDPPAFQQLGFTLMLMGQPEAGIPHIERAIRLNPHDPSVATYYSGLGVCHLLLGHLDDAIDLLRKARSANRRLWFVHLWLAGALGFRVVPSGFFVDAEGLEFARGISDYSRGDAQGLIGEGRTGNGSHAPESAGRTSKRATVLVKRDNIVLLDRK